MANDYRQTLNLPKTEFPMKADLARREPGFQQRWNEIGLYAKLQTKAAPKGDYILHDGPPYSNGPIHMGTAMNKILKDFVVKYRTMQGYRAPYVPGYDNHGMPIENAVTRKLREKKIPFDKITLRKACREHAVEFIGVQSEQFKRLGVLGEWENPYITMDYQFEAAIVRAFGGLVKNGYIYRGLKPVLWCPVDETALADAEVEYGEHTSDSIYVRFPLLEDPNGVFDGQHNPHVVIWTTTPWTIPANMAVAVSPDLDYALVKIPDSTLLIVTDLVEQVMEACGYRDYQVVKTLAGKHLAGLVFKHPIFDRPSPLLVAETDHKGQPFVSATDGTGIVHIAPGHGEADFHLGLKNGIEVLNPVDSRGVYTDKAGEFAGLNARAEGGLQVMERLKELDRLLAHSRYQHQYPHCWRCGSALMFRATVQWFMNIDHENHRERCLKSVNEVQWFPPQGINRITAMVENRPDWCLSRQRAWGVGIPAFYCEGCEEPLVTPDAVEAVAQLVEREGSDAWFSVPASEILPAGTQCAACGGSRFTKEQDVLDVWFDSGSTHLAVLDARPNLHSPADLYLEGSDQHRGWFNSSLMVSMGVKGHAPYKTVVTHGFILDDKRYKMSKSRGNTIDPLKMCEKFGADILRLWGASINYFEDVSISEQILTNMSNAYRDFRNTLRFMLANLADFDPATAVPYDTLLELDRWALARLQQVIAEATEAYDRFEFSGAVQAVSQFIATDLSPLYLDVLKDRLYASKADSLERRSAQTALLAIASGLTRLMAPVLAHTADEVWSYLPEAEKQESVHLEAFPVADDRLLDAALLERWARLLEVREQVGPAVEEWRQSFKNEATGAKARDSVEAKVVLTAGPELLPLLESYKEELAGLFKVSAVQSVAGADGLTVAVELAEGEKCERCWLVKTDIGGDAAHPTLCARCTGVVA